MKNAEIKHWLRKANQQGCEDYIVIAIDKNHNMIASAEASFENMLEMLGSFAEQNPGFKEVLLTAAGYFITKENAKKEGDKK
jgi:hypothetical protein